MILASSISRRVLLGLAALALLAAAPVAAYSSATWYEDAAGYAEASRQQKRRQAPMLVYFRVDWCPYCRKLDALLEEPAVRRRLAGLVKVRVNPEHGEAEERLFEVEYSGRAFPSLWLVPADGGPPRKLSSRGPADVFLAQLPE